MVFHPWCAALKCPEPGDCAGYISRNQGNQAAQSFVACCKIQCGRSANKGLVALQCGGASGTTAIGVSFYLLALFFIGGYVIAFGPFRRLKRITFFVIAGGQLVFSTATGMFVTNFTSPFRVLDSLPAVGAMNVAVFFYFFSGFQYAVGLSYEGAPLVVFVTTLVTIWNEVPWEVEGPVRQANRAAMAMLVTAGIWIFHSVSYRLYGYRVEWRQAKQDETNANAGEPSPMGPGQMNPSFYLGAAQGHPTWRTPVGQSASVLLTTLAWTVLICVQRDLAQRRCRQDWVFLGMLWGAPLLVSLTILWQVFSANRCRKICNVTLRPPESNEQPPKQQPEQQSWFVRFLNWMGWDESASPTVDDNPAVPAAPVGGRVVTAEAEYPGYAPYRRFRKYGWSWTVQTVWVEYVQAAALQRMGRNSVHVEYVHTNRLTSSDQIFGFSAWLLALAGLIGSVPFIFILKVLSETMRIICIRIPACRRLVETHVEDDDKASLVKEVEKCYMGKELGKDPVEYDNMIGDLDIINDANLGRSANLHVLLDNTGPAELFALLEVIEPPPSPSSHGTSGSAW